MIIFLTTLKTGISVDSTILKEKNKLVLIRFGITQSIGCKRMDDILEKIELKLKDLCTFYKVDIYEVNDFSIMYELYDPCSIMFFYRNKHIMIDLGTGNNNKINWVINNKQELIDIIETIYRGVKKGKGLILSPKDYSTKFKY